jgi:hypothetical protein
MDHAAVGRLLDKSLPLFERKAAADRLNEFPCQLACDVLYSVILDSRDHDVVREEAAGALGVLWSEMEVDYPRFRRLPEKYQQIAMVCMGS